MADTGKALRTLRKKVESGDRGAPEDREALIDFSDRLFLLNSKYSVHRHLKLLRHCVRMSEHSNASVATARTDRKAAETIVQWINAEYDNPETNRDYRVALRVFGRRTTEADGPPAALDWIPANTPSNYSPTPDPAAMLRWDADVKPMIDAAANARDAALIATAFDSGARSGELRSLRVGDVSDGTDYGLSLRVDGKTGERTVTLVPSEPYLSEWLGAHPASTIRDAPLWCALGRGDALSYRRFRDIFDEVAARAGVKKPVTPTNFRKSNASWLARQGANAALIEDRQGRARNSEAVSRYVARFGEADEAAQYAALHGIEVDTGADEELAPVECPRCERQTPHDERMCVWCGRALDAVAAEMADTVRDTLRSRMATSDDAETRAALLDSLEELDRSPEAAADLVEAALERHSDTSSS